jgi:UDP-3-O-[3-hydroxymyristoyl] glucosamine N-acyltransferase
MQIQALARTLNAQVDPSLNLEIKGVNSMEEAGPDDVTFLSNPKYISKLKDCQAGAILVSRKFTDALPMPALQVDNPYLAFAQAIELFHHKPHLARTVHPTVVIGHGVGLGNNVAIGAYVVIGNDVQIGDDVTIYPHCMIYDGAVIGAGSTLHSHVVVREQVSLGQRVILQNGAVIGADGYGFAPLQDGTFYKIRQAGTVVLEDDVEVQAHSTIDRATVGKTRIGRGTKIDNLVQVGHGSTVGTHTLICGQVGLAGSTKVGNHVILAGQVGVAGHLTIGDRVVAAAQSGIAQSVSAGRQICGAPAVEGKLYLRMMAELKNLPKIVQRLRRLEQQVNAQGQATSAQPEPVNPLLKEP